ncbi:MAG: hypothetical protein ABIP80_03625 [Ferruginibacter sp.]
MRKILVLFLTAATCTAFSQGKTIYSVSWVKPKIGMNSAFENAWKNHISKFHNGDDKRMVFEIVSGDRAGYYQFVKGPMSYSDMDTEKPNQSAHDMDYEKNVASKVSEESGNYYYQYLDSLTLNPGVQADKSVVTINSIKNGKMGDYRDEIKKGVMVSRTLNVPVNNHRYQLIAAGSNPVMVSVYNLKDGFKQLDQDYFKMAPNFRDNYITTYGFNNWEKRTDLFDDIIVKTETFLRKRRADLSSK